MGEKKIKKSAGFTFRMTEDDREMLSYISYITGESMSVILRKALKMYYNLVKHRA